MRKDKNSLCLSKSKRREELHKRIGCIIKNTPGLEEYIEDRKKDIDLYETYRLHIWENKLRYIFNKAETPSSLLKNDMEKSLNVDEVSPFISCTSKLIAFLYKNKKYRAAEDVNDMIYTFIMNKVDCYIHRINRIDDDSWFEIVSIIDSILEFYTYLEKQTDCDKHFCTIPTKIINRLELYIQKIEKRLDKEDMVGIVFSDEYKDGTNLVHITHNQSSKFVSGEIYDCKFTRPYHDLIFYVPKDGDIDTFLMKHQCEYVTDGIITKCGISQIDGIIDNYPKSFTINDYHRLVYEKSIIVRDELDCIIHGNNDYNQNSTYVKYVLLKIDTIYKTAKSIYTDSCIESHVDGFKFKNHDLTYEDKYNMTYRYIVISNLPDDVLNKLHNESKYGRFNFKQIGEVGAVIYEGDEKYSFIRYVMELSGYKSGSRNINIFGGRL